MHSVARVAVVSVSLGNFDVQHQHVEQDIACDYFYVSDKEFPPRSRSMTPRLQARITKTFMWQMFPGYDYYLWVDASCRLDRSDAVRWFLEKCFYEDIVVFRHPNRKTIREEAAYLEKRLVDGCGYITPRYEGELIAGQLNEIFSDPTFSDDNLYASTSFMMNNQPHMQKVMKEWWYHISRYHSIDQLSLPYVLHQFGCSVDVIEQSYLKVPYLKYMR